ncbi:LIM and calponin homology domains-containing protein 1a isoform X2 [Conger conger]|uniref:LIM and calponin homology domains-containing protein 1a isoform X2 n=1 Tax=Conger conger TaxID=82655 RepID=UPI002A5A6902|nr:LIM and calponin homology domains-containing protein 1a isoform X2 [Conger conger]
MASPGCDIGRNSHQHQHQQSESAPEPAFQEAQKWIEEATGRRFGDRDFRSSLENGILLCELLSCIRPGLVKKINRLPTPIAGLDNLCLFLRGCGSLGLKGTQLFDPGDLQDTSVRANLRGSDCSRKLKNVLITIYWLGKAAQNSTSYSGPTLDLKVFEGLLSQMKKDSEDTETLRGSIGDSGYIDSGEAEHSESLSPPHGRGDSFDSLDSLGSPSPDVLIPACSEGRGSDSECDGPRRLPDVQKDDMLTRRTICAEPHPTAPFNQYLPNKSSTSAYGPAPLRKKRPDPEEVQTSGSTATSPIGGEQPISRVPCMRLGGAQVEGGAIRQKTVTWGGESRAEPALWEGPEEQEMRRMQKLEKAGIRVLPAAVRYLSLKHVAEEEPMEEATPPCPSIVLRKASDFLQQAEQAWASDEEEDDEGRRLPDVQKDDLASRRARMSHSAPRVHHFLPSASDGHVREEWEGLRRAWQRAALSESEAHTAPCKEEEEQEGGRGPQALPNLEKDDLSRRRAQSRPPPRAPPQPFINASITPSDLQTWQRLKMSTEPSETPPPEMSHAIPCKEEEEQEGGRGPQALPNLEKDDLSRRRAQSRPPPRAPPQPFINASITPSDLQTWQRLKMSTEPSEEPPVCQACLQKGSLPSEQDHLLPSEQEDHALRPVPAQHSAPSGRPRFVHFGPVTEMDQQLWERLRIAQPGQEEELGVGPGSEAQTLRRLLASAAVATPTIGLSSQLTDKPASADVSDGDSAPLAAADCALDQTSLYEQACRENQALDQKLAHYKEREEEEDDEEAGEREGRQPDLQKDDMLVRRTGVCQKPGTGSSFNRFLPLPGSFRGTPKIKTEALPYTPKTKAEALPSTPQTKTDPPPDIPKIKTEGLPSTPQTEMDTLPDIHKIKTEGMSDTTKTKMEALPDNMQREPFLDSSKSRVKMNLSKPQTRQELSVATSVLHHPDPQKDRINHPDPEKRIAASAKPVPGVAEMIQVATAYYGSPDDYNSDDDDEYEEESHPDLGKDDMHARRTGQFQKVPGGGVTPAINPFLPVPGSVKFKSTPTPTSSPSSPYVKPLESEPVSDAHSSSLFSAELNCPPVPAATRTTATTTTSTSMTSPITLSPKHSAAPSAPPLPLSSTLQSEPRRRPSWLDDLPPMSVSMTDMRCEETAEQALGEARQELMQSQYNQHREEESQWQDDLARWKNRRRTASQDLIKKEEERKMMERLMVRDDRASQRRKSIKTYKEIVEEKERREQELHDAYRSACSPEEAATVLRRYAQRFTLSDAALERLQLSKPAELAAPGPAPSAGPTPAAPGPAPSAGPTPAAPGPAPSACPTPVAPGPAPSPVATGPAPSLGLSSSSGPTPSQTTDSCSVTTTLIPKFSATLETSTMAPVQAYAPSCTAPSKPVPLLTPKPYSQPSSSQRGSISVKAPPTPVQAPVAQRKDTPPSQPDQEATPSHPRPLPTCHRALGVSQGVYGPAQSPAEPTEGGAHTPGSPLLPEGREKDSSSQVDHWSWDPDEERKRQERWQQKQELLLQERYEQEQEKLKREWEKAQMEVQEEERRHHEEERRILEETMPSLSPRSSALSSPLRGGLSPPPGPQDLTLPSPANMELKQEQPVQAVSPEEALMGQKDRSETHRVSLPLTPVLPELNAAPHQNGQSLPAEPSRSTTPQQQPFNSPWSSKQAQSAQQEAEKMQKKTASLDRNLNPQPGRAKRCGSCENVATNSSPANSSSIHPQSPNRSVSGRKLCSSCGLPLGKGAAMIIESLHLCFHIQCFTCGVCKGQLGDTSSGTDVRIRNGLLNCHQCYVKSRAAGQPTIL